MSLSSRSAYGEFPSSSLDPPLPSLKSGLEFSSCKYAFFNIGELDKDKKSLEEKSMDVVGAMLKDLRAELALRVERIACIEASRGEDFILDSQRESKERG